MDGTPGDNIATTTTTDATGNDSGAPAVEQPRALTFAERAARLRELADNATEFGGLRSKLTELADFAEAVAARLDALDNIATGNG